MRPRLPLVVLPLLAACGGADPPLRSADGDLLVRPEALAFPRTFVGYPTAVPLELTNGGRTALALEVRFAGDAGPFSLPAGARTLAGAEVLPLEVRFAPVAPGRFVAAVALDADRGGRTVELSGVAEAPPPCDPADPCETATFDPTSGECRRARKAEGEACSTGNPCQVDERCVAEVCVGRARDCDDGKNCTRDSCDPANRPDGCRHEDVTPTCPVSENPCEVPACDEAAGCTLGPAPEGARCGSFTCAAAHVCVSGTCVETDVPDGWPCNASCGDGACRAKECVRPDGDVLDESWSYAPPDAGTRLSFAGLVDEEGRLYWIEATPEPAAALVSATLDGFVRYRVPLSHGEPRELALAGGAVVLARDGWLDAYETADGALRWSRDVGADLPAGPATFGPLLAFDDGTLALVATTGGETLLVALAADAGAPLASTRVGPAPASPDGVGAVADETGAIYVGLPGEPAAGSDLRSVELVAFAPDRRERWRRTVEARRGEGLPIAAHDGTLVLAPARVLEAADGADRFALDVPPVLAGPAVLLGTGHGFTVDPAAAEVVPFDLADGTVAGRGPLFEDLPEATAPTFTAPVLTSRERALLASSWWDGAAYGARVREYAADGTAARTCTIPDPGPIEGRVALRGDRLAVAGPPGLRVFELPRGETAGAGWTGPAGNPGGGGSAR